MSKYFNVDPEHYKKPIVIGSTEIRPGENAFVKINVGRLPSANRINIIAHVFRSEKPGPTALLIGGIHGDEINGIEIVRRAVEKNVFSKLECGSVIAIPILNVYGFINFSRSVPDGKDVNRSFPGSATGSLASRVAYTISKKILPLVDFGIDFHTGGRSRYNYPQIRYTKTDPVAEQLAHMFAPPLIIQKAMIPKTFRRVATNMGIPLIVYEAGESIRLEGFSIDHGLAGMKRVLSSLGIMSDDSSSQMNDKSLLFARTGWIRASYSGIFIWTKRSGARVQKGEPLGVINDPHGLKSVTVFSKKEGYIIGHNNASVVSQGDALFHIGFDFKKVD